MKSKDADFPESLLQQFNFREAEEAATVEESENVEATEEIEGESEEEQ